MIRKLLQNIWDTIISMEMAVILLILIITASLAGTFTKYDVYHNSWFIGILFIFGINLSLCTARRAIRRTIRVGSFISHVGMIVILIGVIVSAVYGERGQLSISEGETLGRYNTKGRAKDLPFRIRLDDFQIGWDRDSPHKIHLTVVDQGISKDLDVELGGRYKIDGTGYTIEVTRFVPDLFVDSKLGVISKSEQPLNPALLVLIENERGTEKRWLFANYPDFTMSKDRNVVIRYKYGKKAIDFKSIVTILEDDKEQLRSTIEVNHPLKYKGYSIYQAHFDQDHPKWTGLEIVKDPGVNIVFAGILSLNIGVIVALYSRRKGI